MKAILNLLILTGLLLVWPSRCFALVELADVSKERAKEMGVTIRSRPNGDAGVAVWLEFKTQGVLKNFTHADVRIYSEDGKSLVHAPLQVSRPAADSVSVNFSADPAWLNKSILTITVKNGERTLVGYQFKVKDFVEQEKSGKAGSERSK